MKKLLIICVLALSNILMVAQTPRYLRFRSFRDGKIVGEKRVLINEPVKQIKPTVVTKTRIKTVVKTIKGNTEYKLVNVTTAPTALDTVAILQQYYPKNVYKETLRFDEGSVTVTDTISHNRVVGRIFIADVKPITKERIVEIYRPKEIQWYMGPHITTNFTQPIQSFGISVIRKSLNDNLIQIQVGGNVHEGSMRPNAYFGIGGLLKLK